MKGGCAKKEKNPCLKNIDRALHLFKEGCYKKRLFQEAKNSVLFKLQTGIPAVENKRSTSVEVGGGVRKMRAILQRLFWVLSVVFS